MARFKFMDFAMLNDNGVQLVLLWTGSYDVANLRAQARAFIKRTYKTKEFRARGIHQAFSQERVGSSFG